ncbi:G2 M phase-specific E3 ubiquitin- ligase [Paramuricea clavata]|uniref:G2 M phase-specific E3 ubiquitin- ligase n=1 Tax=Paramuricea clavata TaxID=317549 RepID=A0A6S7JB21_PARCT|nr:G2 M phase-specific E3 ubiquitin- ligase [Paramuricea clavata]
MSEKFKEDIRNTIQQTVREELSKVLPSNKDTGECSSSETSQSTPTTSTTSATPNSETSCQSRGQSSTLSFRDFYRIREASRQEDFKPTKKKKRGNEASASGAKSKQPKEVEIKVGMAYVIDGVFKIRRNKTHILKVKTDIEKEELIEKAIIKHGNFDQSFDRVSPYVLLYPDFSEVNFVPGTEEIFSLVKYKEAISKDYKKLTFYLCLRDEYQYNQFSDWSSPDDNEENNDTKHEKNATVNTTKDSPPIFVMDDDDDPMLLLAINRSQQDENMPVLSETANNEEKMSAEPSSLDEALELKMNDIPNDNYTVIEVTRKHLVERTFELLKDEDDIKGRVIVKFIGEETVDTGGVTREFFTNFFQSILSNGNIFRGSYPNLTFRHNLHALEEGQFEMFGILTAIALLNGCPGPHFLCHSLASFILDNQLEVVLDDVPAESEFKTKLIQIQGCNNEAELSNIVNSFPERFDMGYTKPVLTLNDKDDLIRFCSKHVVISSVAEEIFSFRKGLSIFGVLHELCKFNEAGLAELVYQDINTDHVKACFKPCFSAVGTDEHGKETEIVYKWQQFLKKSKSGKLKSKVLACPDWNNPDQAISVDDSPVVKSLSLNDILQFGSGSRFPNFKGSLAFDHQCTDAHKRLTGNTCALTICIPVNERYTKCNTDTFALNIMEDIFQDYGLGQR